MNAAAGPLLGQNAYDYLARPTQNTAVCECAALASLMSRTRAAVRRHRWYACVDEEEGRPRDEHQNFRSTESWLHESQPAEIVSIYFVPMGPQLVPASTGCRGVSSTLVIGFPSC